MNELGATSTPFFFFVDYEMENIILSPTETLEEEILYKLPEHTNNPETNCNLKLDLTVHPYPKKAYAEAFTIVMDEILYGNTFLINLTAQHEVTTKASLKEIYDSASAPYKLYIKDKLVVFSPETFVKIHDGTISSYPMKGTIDADLPEAERLLLENEKETAEHNTIIDLIRNDLSIHAKKVKVTKYRYLDLIKSNNKNLYQMSSEISGKLPDHYNETIGTILFSLLPAGSISGAPKKKTIEIISKVEEQKRGYYTGVCGIFDGTNLDSFVAIRFIEKKQNKLFYRSGGGITFQSNMDNEYQEMIDKVYIPLS